jgi:hypothetical protein
VQTNFNEFREGCDASLILPENALKRLIRSPRKSRGNHIASIKSGDPFLHNQGHSRRFRDADAVWRQASERGCSCPLSVR